MDWWISHTSLATMLMNLCRGEKLGFCITGRLPCVISFLPFRQKKIVHKIHFVYYVHNLPTLFLHSKKTTDYELLTTNFPKAKYKAQSSKYKETFPNPENFHTLYFTSIIVKF